MAIDEERLTTVEYSLKQFKTETIKVYQEMALEVTMLKGLTEDAVKRIMSMRKAMDTRFDNVDGQIAGVKQDIIAMDTRFDKVEGQVAEVKRDITEVKRDIIGVKQDIIGVKRDITEVKQDITEVKQDITEVKQDIKEQGQVLQLILARLSLAL